MNQFAGQEKKHTENGHVDMRRERGSGVNWETGIDIYTPPCVKLILCGKLLYIAQGAQLGALWCGDLNGWAAGCGREVQEGRDVCLHMDDSLCCMAETNTTL